MMGMPDVFGGGADLTGMAGSEPGGISISKASHDAFVKVNEEGTEAAAVTTIVMSESGPTRFVADHPFIFLIQDDESGTILFMGKVMDPTKT
jgi:serpin B